MTKTMEMAEMAELLDVLQAEKDAREESDAVYKTEKVRWENFAKQYQAMRSAGSTDSIERIAGLVRRYGPKIAMRFGMPGAAAGLTALVADKDAFGGVLGTLKGLLGLVF